jgi:UDP-glucose 4-epimerase
MRVAITGAGGLLGGAVLRKVIASGHDVVALSGSLCSMDGIEIVRWDAVQDWTYTAAALRDVEVVVHAGAHIPLDHGDVTEATRCFEVNALGTLNLLKAVEYIGVRRFIYVSGTNTLNPRSEFVREDDPVCCEQSPYYLGSKVLGEIYFRAAMARGLDGLIVRASSLYGLDMKTGIIWNFAERVKRGAPISLQNGGRFKADYIWRDDVATVLTQAIVGHHQSVVNLGSGVASSVLDVAKLIVEIFDADPSLIKFEVGSDESGRRGFDAVDITRARDWFGFSPTSLRDGLMQLLVSGEA